MRGYRKLLIAIGAMLVAALVSLNPNQADVIISVVYATMGANAAVHIGGAISGAIGIRSNGSGSSDSGAPRVSEEESGPESGAP